MSIKGGDSRPRNVSVSGFNPFMCQCHDEKDETTIAESNPALSSKRGERKGQVCTCLPSSGSI